jgi:selenium-dependent xanthine dehydrogenase
MEFILNGSAREFSGDPDLPLLTYLRLYEGITSAKNGCAPQAACGACTVDLDCKGVLSCVTPMKKVAGGVVTTIEGLGAYRQDVYANAFAAKGGVQCGFCIPGIVMRSNVLINKNPEPSPSDIEKALTPNLCRCTGYKKIIDSVLYAAQAIRAEEEVPVPMGEGTIGSRQPKYQAQELVLGQHEYVDDISLKGMTYGAIKFSDHPRARLLSIDTSEAQDTAGVLRVFTAEDIPGDRHIGLIRKDWPLMIAVGEITRYVGDVLAFVVAETEAAARDAVERIVVEYEVLEPLTDMHRALEEGAPSIHEGGNILSQTIIQRGDLEKASLESDFISQGVYETQMIEHGYMEPEASIAYPSDGGITVFSQGQGIYEDRLQIAQLLDLPKDKVRIILVPNGGGFGGKEDLSVQGHAALGALALDKPVKITLTREESILMHPKRHPIWMEYKLGCNKDGMLTFLQARFIGDTGAYASVGMKVLERAAGHATGAYHLPVADIKSVAVYTNNIPCGAMRGFGVNQAAFGLESCIDELCEQGEFDRWQFRYDNALQAGSKTATGQVIESGAGLRQTLEAVKDEFYSSKYAGLACGLKNTGIGNGIADAASVRITIAAADKVILDHGWTEMGQGLNTIATQVICQETGIDPGIVEVHIDTQAEQEAGMTTASRATSLVGNALIETCKELKEDLKTNTLADLIGRQYQREWRVDWTTKPGADVEEVKTHYSYSYATQLVVLDDDGNIKKVTAAHDAGKIFNPTLFEGQIEGSIHMGLGYATSEGIVMEGGRPNSTHLRKMGILRAKEMPEIEVIGVEVPDAYGPYGAKGIGEIGLVPTAAAVANALYQYDGVRRVKLPVSLPNARRRY